MYICGIDSPLQQMFVELFGHSLRQSGYQSALPCLYALSYLLHQVVYLIKCRTDLNFRIEKACRSDHLLHKHSFGLLQLIISGSCADIDGLRRQTLELFEFQGSVVQCGRQTETIFHQIDLA